MRRDSRARRSTGCARLALIAAIPVLTAVGAVPNTLAGKKKQDKVVVAGTVSYEKRDCFKGPASKVPLPAAEVLLEPANAKPKVTTLDAAGRFRAKVSGGRPIEAFVDLDGPRLSVRPDSRGSRPYRIHLGRLDPGKSFGENKLLLGGVADAGAANIWAVLDEGARVAAQASPVKLQPIRALWRYKANLKDWLGDRPGSAYDDAPSPAVIYVGGSRAGANDDRFEAFPLLHEYGHHVLTSVANPGPESGGEHSFVSIHRDRPALPWSEGFANAFATIVLGNPQPMLGCDPRANLGTAPATATTAVGSWPPSGGDERFAQYNETAAGGVVWEFADRFGSGQPRAGLKSLLGAVNVFHARHGGPESLREFRDALIAGGVETTAQDHSLFTEVFARQRTGWAFAAQVEIADGTDPGGFGNFLPMKAEGPAPYGTCDGTGPELPSGTVRGASGALDYAWQDDCYVANGEGSIAHHNALYVPYPAIGAAGFTEEPFTVYARWQCEDPQPDDFTRPPCSNPAPVEIFLWRGSYVGEDPSDCLGCLPYTEIEQWGAEHAVSGSLPRDTWTPIATFDSLGHCTSLLDGADCGL